VHVWHEQLRQLAKKPTAAYDKQFGDFVIDPTSFTQLVYIGV